MYICFEWLRLLFLIEWQPNKENLVKNGISMKNILVDSAWRKFKTVHGSTFDLD